MHRPSCRGGEALHLTALLVYPSDTATETLRVSMKAFYFSNGLTTIICILSFFLPLNPPGLCQSGLGDTLVGKAFALEA